MSLFSSDKHPHEPEIPPVLDDEGRCRICGLLLAGDVLYGAVIWMSGSPSFGPEGEAHEGWVKVRESVGEAHETFLKVSHSPHASSL